MPERPPADVKGSGLEFYNVDFSLYSQVVIGVVLCN